MLEIPDSLRGIAQLPEEGRQLLVAACEPDVRAERVWNACNLVLANEPVDPEKGQVHRLEQFRGLSQAEFAALPPQEVEDLCCFELAACLNRYLSVVLSVEAIQEYWEYTVACGIIARRLAPLCDVDPAAAFAGALGHDLGRLVLMARHPERYSNLLIMARRSFSLGVAVDLRAYERNLFGMDRYTLGTLLADEWNLPAQLKPLLGEFDREALSLGFGLVDLVRGSCRLAHCLGYGFLRGGQTLHPMQILSQFPQAVQDEIEENPTLLGESTREGLAASASWITAMQA